MLIEILEDDLRTKVRAMIIAVLIVALAAAGAALGALLVTRYGSRSDQFRAVNRTAENAAVSLEQVESGL